jgi:integrase
MSKRRPIALNDLSFIEKASSSDISDQALEQLAKKPISSSTQEIYAGRLGIFEAWASRNDWRSFPTTPEVVQRFVVFEAGRGLALSTVRTSVCAIGHFHRDEGYRDPTESERVRNTLQNIARVSDPPSRISKPVRREKFVRMIRALRGAPENGMEAGDTGKPPSVRTEANRLRGIRDRALLLIVFGGALRRSEGAGIKCAHVSFEDRGLKLLIPGSKGDQVREGQRVCIRCAESEELCPAQALQRWLREASINEGPIFRPVPPSGNIPSSTRGPICGATVNDAVKRAAAAAGFTPDEVSAHSLRYGHLITAAEEGASLANLQRHARHSDPQTTARYIQEANRMSTTTSQHLEL